MPEAKKETRKSALQVTEITVHLGQVKQKEQNQTIRASDKNHNALRTRKAKKTALTKQNDQHFEQIIEYSFSRETIT